MRMNGHKKVSRVETEIERRTFHDGLSSVDSINIIYNAD